MGAIGRVPLYHFSQPLDLDSVRIKNDWEVDVKTRHTVFHFSLWPGKIKLEYHSRLRKWNKDTKQKNEDVEYEDEKDDNTTVLTATEEKDLPIIQPGIDDVDEADEGVTIPSEPLVLLENINLEPMPLVQSTTHTFFERS